MLRSASVIGRLRVCLHWCLALVLPGSAHGRWFGRICFQEVSVWL